MVEKEDGGGARRTFCDLYLAKVSELLNFPAPKKETRWRRRDATRGSRGGKRERKRKGEREKELVL